MATSISLVAGWFILILSNFERSRSKSATSISDLENWWQAGSRFRRQENLKFKIRNMIHANASSWRKCNNKKISLFEGKKNRRVKNVTVYIEFMIWWTDQKMIQTNDKTMEQKINCYSLRISELKRKWFEPDFQILQGRILSQRLSRRTRRCRQTKNVWNDL